MNTQLILFPQNYKGYTYTSASIFEYVVDGINFTTIMAAPALTNVGTPIDDLILQPPTIINSWYKSRSTITIPFAYASAGLVSGLIFTTDVPPAPPPPVTQTISRVYQRLSNLIPGAQYTFTVDSIASGSGATISLRVFNGATNTTISFGTFSPQGTSHFLNFIPQTATDIIMVYVTHNVPDTVHITKIAVKETIIDPTKIYTDLLDGQVICDLYEEEDIPLTLSVDDFTNVAEQVKGYSKDFDLPGTKRNNRIFNNMFEVTRTVGVAIFNPYVKTKCVLKQDGFILFEGYLRMIDIKDQEGEISYNVNLYDEVIALKDELNERTFADLDFSELDHDYDWAVIKGTFDDAVGLALINPLNVTSPAYDPALGAGRTNVLKYPFIDWTHQHIEGGTGSANAFVGQPELTTLEQAFRPCIQLKYIIDKIFNASSFGYTSAYFNASGFEKLFMDFNWGSGQSPVQFSTTGDTVQLSGGAVNDAQLAFTEVLFPSPITAWGAEAGFDTATSIFTATSTNVAYNLNYTAVFLFTGTTTLNLRWFNSSTGLSVDVASIAGVVGQQYNYNGFISQILTNIGDTLSMQFSSSGGVGLVKQNNTYGGAIIANVFGAASNSAATSQQLLQTLRGELGQWEFLDGLTTMFNLVSMKDENNENNILIEPYRDIFAINGNSGTISDLTLASRSIEHDWTDKVDASEMELKPLTNLNRKSTFKFAEDDDDYAFNVYKNSTGSLYGSKTISQISMDILEGTEEIIVEPFAATVSKPLDSGSNIIAPALYSMNDNGTSEGFDNMPRIFYNNGEKTIAAGGTYFVPAQNLVTWQNYGSYLQFSHLTVIPTNFSATTFDFVFESGMLIGLGPSPINNLYNRFWAPYFNQLYHADTRIMDLKVNLTPGDVANFKFYDKVMIKNRSFRVNKIEYKPNALATVEFILIP